MRTSATRWESARPTIWSAGGLPTWCSTTGSEPVRLAELTTTARPLLLDLTEDASLTTAADGWRDRVDTVTAHTKDASTTGLLLRPDCYVAWATDTPRPDHHDRESLRTALTTWFGPG